MNSTPTMANIPPMPESELQPPIPSGAWLEQPDEEAARGSDRRSFLRRITRASLWAAPVVYTIWAREAHARGSGGGGGGKAVGQVAGGDLSPVNQQLLLAPEFRSQNQTPATQPWAAPWNTPPGTPPPWSRPPAQPQDSRDDQE